MRFDAMCCRVALDPEGKITPPPSLDGDQRRVVEQLLDDDDVRLLRVDADRALVTGDQLADALLLGGVDVEIQGHVHASVGLVREYLRVRTIP